MPIIRATLIFFLLASSLALTSGLPAQEPPKDAQAAVREIESLLAESSRVPPGSPGPSALTRHAHAKDGGTLIV